MARTIVAFTLCAFRALLEGSPLPVPDVDFTPGPFEAFFAFMLGYLLLVMLLLWLLPETWPVYEIAFGLKPEGRKGETK
jgi:hypothetical protein